LIVKVWNGLVNARRDPAGLSRRRIRSAGGWWPISSAT